MKTGNITKRILSVMLTAMLVFAGIPLIPSGVKAVAGVKYIDTDGTEKTQDSVTELSNNLNP